MTEITGIIQSMESREVKPGMSMTDITVGGEKYGAGMTKYLKCKEGDYVKFTLDDARGYKNVARNTLKVSANKAPAEAVAAAAATAPATSSTGGRVDTRQDTISRQAASNTAIQFLQLLASADALGLPAAAAKGKKAEAMDALLAKYEQHFYENNTGVKWKSVAPATSERLSSADEGETDAVEEVSAEKDDWS